MRAGRGSVVEKRYADDPGEPNSMYPNLPDHEAMAMSFLAGTGCAPELVSYRAADTDAGALVVYRFVPGTPWMSGVADVARLLHRAPDAVLKKIGEEATETVMACKDGLPERIVSETADLWFHCLVMLEQHGLRPEAVLAELMRREGLSGLDEKAARQAEARQQNEPGAR